MGHFYAKMYTFVVFNPFVRYNSLGKLTHIL
jgi:hypothetical protein